ncbi:MAG: ATP-binding protein [Nonlabens sp.]
MKYNPADFYRYFRECYRLDNKEFKIDNILAAKYPHKWFVTDQEEFLTEDYPVIPYFNKKGDQLAKDIEIYKLEKQLYYGYIFFLGKKDHGFSKDKRICAPLLLFPVKLEVETEASFLRIDRDDVVINKQILNYLELRNGFSKDNFCSELTDLVTEENLSAQQIGRLISKYFTEPDLSELAQAPMVWSVSQIRAHYKKIDPTTPIKIIPAAGTVFVEKSHSSLKVLEDLEKLAVLNEYSSAWSNQEEKFGNQKTQDSLLKYRLNTDQFQALENSENYANSVVIGPPGTGKSYTISAMATNAILNNESVLVVGKTRESVQVVRKMLENDFKLKNHIVQTSGSRYKYSLQTKVKNLLTSIHSTSKVYYETATVEKLRTKIEQLEYEFETMVAQEIELTDIQFSDRNSIIDWFKKHYLEFILKNQQFSQRVFKRLGNDEKQLHTRLSSYIKRRIERNRSLNLNQYRKDLVAFRSALTAYNFTEYKAILNQLDFSKVLKSLPLWLVHLNELNAVAPLKKDIFDLIIIDEATQCDIAVVLPAIYRAKRVVVVGDPNQLSHYSFVSRKQQLQLQKRFQLPDEPNLNFRERSVLDFYIDMVKDQNQVTFLKEHYRSTPSIIEFSNEQFYSGQLKVLKSTPKHTSINQVKTIQVKNAVLENGVNMKEAEQVIKETLSIINRFSDAVKVPSLGILSPLSKQVEILQKLINEHVEYRDIKKFELICGGPYHFQGSERDIILLSLGLTDQSHHAAFAQVANPRVFNVSITRARSEQLVFNSLQDKNRLKKYPLLADYLEFIAQFDYQQNVSDEHDQFQDEVFKTLNKIGCDQVICSYPLAGNLLDILVIHKEQHFFLDLIGYPGMFQEAFSMERYRVLNRVGIQTIPIHWNNWKNKKRAITKLLENEIIKD